MVKYFSNGLISGILLRLLVKSLVRIKSVLKPWCFLIDDPYFTTGHLKHSAENNGGSKLILRKRTGRSPELLRWLDLDSISTPGMGKLEAVELGLPMQKNGDTDVLIGSCNGLICLYQSPNIFLWNKSTGEYHVTTPYNTV
ncbi:hypothetical protein SLE2022_189510 [Rubroshorea leprosula]